MHAILKPYRRLQLHVRHRMHSSYTEHEAIVAAIEAGDAAAAEQALKDHVHIQGKRFTDLVANIERLHS
ncbi:FCD domain-containing protein [Cobetia crustatorum]|uniref:FCD domain-containing protein n=1 Tax=Cobetia crustatorum TaxID=553385 RepID=UPI0009FFCC1E|nr:FCD domain-containing protein [Cobetia crustatorum]